MTSTPYSPAILLAGLLALPAEDHPYKTRSIPPAWGFGFGPQMADKLGQLAFQGIKTATASLLWEYQHEQEALPQSGDLNIILDGQDLPLCIIRTTQVVVIPLMKSISLLPPPKAKATARWHTGALPTGRPSRAPAPKSSAHPGGYARGLRMLPTGVASRHTLKIISTDFVRLSAIFAIMNLLVFPTFTHQYRRA